MEQVDICPLKDIIYRSIHLDVVTCGSYITFLYWMTQKLVCVCNSAHLAERLKVELSLTLLMCFIKDTDVMQ